MWHYSTREEWKLGRREKCRWTNSSGMERDQLYLFSSLRVLTGSPSCMRKGGGGDMRQEAMGSGRQSAVRGQELRRVDRLS